MQISMTILDILQKKYFEEIKRSYLTLCDYFFPWFSQTFQVVGNPDEYVVNNLHPFMT